MDAREPRRVEACRLHFHPRIPEQPLRVGSFELLTIQRAIALIEDLGADLDRQLETETRAAERLRLLRETTNRITRAANDAIQAYRKGQSAVSIELERPKGGTDVALLMRTRLRAARLDLLAALRAAGRRYPWTAGPGSETSCALIDR
jgi:hypothetical protein